MSESGLDAALDVELQCTLTLGTLTLGTLTLGIRTLGSLTLGIRTLGSPTLGSPSLGNRAPDDSGVHREHMCPRSMPSSSARRRVAHAAERLCPAGIRESHARSREHGGWRRP